MCILWRIPVTWSKLLSIEYSKLLVPTLVSPTKDNPFVFVVNPTWVTIPIKLSDFLITNISCELDPDSGMLNVVTPLSSDTVKAYPALGLVNVTFWFVSKGWFNNLKLCKGVDTTFTISPRVEFDVEPNPTAVPTPIDSCGLKNTLSFNLELKLTFWAVSSNWKVFGINSKSVPTVWTPDETPLLTLNILLDPNLLRTSNFSVPIPILLPTEIWSGIFERYISVTMPVDVEFGISLYTMLLAVLIPKTWDPFT